MVDISGNVETRFDSASGLVARLDRVYVSTPPWLLTLLSVRARVVASPVQLHSEGISDHAPAMITISDRPSSTTISPAIHPWVFKDPIYNTTLSNLIYNDDILTLPPPFRLNVSLN